MRFIVFFCAFFLLLPTVFGLTPLEASSLNADITIVNDVEFSPTGNDFRIDDAQARLSWFPRDDSIQDVLDLETTPGHYRTPSYLLFEWDNPTYKERISLTSSVQTRNVVIPVRDKVSFPLKEVPSEMSEYLGEGEIVQQSREIVELAQELAGNSKDAYEVVYKLADWTTTNIEYSLASLGEPAIQTSPEVLESRYGKCDEMTALFISLNRALGIPARFVAGYSYTNSPLFDREWGGHGWAEVWLPEVGWVPFDVTYGEYGYLDSGHIKLKTASDAKETSIDYSARGLDFSLNTKPLDIKIATSELRAISNPHIHIKLTTPSQTVGFGSTVLILAEVENLRDFYISTRIDLAQTQDTDLLADNYANILLKPKDKKTIPFLIKISDNLDQGYRYEFPFKAYSRLGEEDTITISVSRNDIVYDATAFDGEIAELKEPEKEKPVFGVTCIQEGYAYLGEIVEHKCVVTGNGPSTLKVCNRGKCEDIVTENNTFTIGVLAEGNNVFTEAYTAKGFGYTADFFLTTTALSPTTILLNITRPDRIGPDDTAQVELFIDYEGAEPEDIEMTMQVVHRTQTETIKDLQRPAKLNYQIPGRALRPGTNTIPIELEYIDELGNLGIYTTEFNIELIDVGILDRMSFFLEDLWEGLAAMLS